MWHCPHCGAPQAETARCWVCRRSSTTCSTCRHFRTSLAADVGYCAKDRWRTPLSGLELRACWEEGRRAGAPRAGVVGPSAGGEEGGPRPIASVRGDGGPLDRPNPMRLRGFVPVEDLAVADPSPERRRAPGPEERQRPAPGPVARKRVQAKPPPSLLPDTIDDWEKRVSLFGEVEG